MVWDGGSKGVLYDFFCGGVKIGGGFIEEDDRGVIYESNIKR